MSRLRRVLVAALVTFTLLGVVPGQVALATAPTPGAPSAGDRLFPGLGNGGYDVRTYDIDLAYDTDTRTVDAAVGVTARATHPLSRFNLDLDGNRVTSVAVDGLPAEYEREGAELVVTPARPLRGSFHVRVDYTADPREKRGCLSFSGLDTGGWVTTDTDDGFALVGQPACMHSVFPSNDIPYDKATYTITVTTPRDLESAANGELVSSRYHGGELTRTFAVTDPMSTQVAQISVGDFVTYRHHAADGTPLRDYVPPDRLDAAEPMLRRTSHHLAWMERRVGVDYPFPVYGILGSEVAGGLETQTLSIWRAHSLADPATEPFLLHEAAHQWFGNSVAIRTWSDLWLSEAHAFFYETMYRAELGEEPLTEKVELWYAFGDRYRAKGGPIARPSNTDYTSGIYFGGATVLYALRQEVGNRAFERIERQWLLRHADRAAGTDDFIRLASQVSGRDLRPFLEDWLYGTKTPPMPGHPDWTVDPVE